MKKTIMILTILFFCISCSSINNYLENKNISSDESKIKYTVIKKEEPVKLKENKQIEIIKSENKKEEVKAMPVATNTNNTQAIIKSENKKETNVVRVVSNVPVPTPAPNPIPKPTPKVVVEEKKVIKDVKFDETDEKIITYISGKVVESEEQIKKRTIDSINKLKEKGIDLSPKEFLAKAYENIKTTNVNSFILAAARVMNNIERGKK